MRYKEIVSELRRNPELNPKTSVNDAIQNKLAATKEKIVTGVPNLFVSFTAMDKLGINPQSRYETPLGIYSYPAKYVVSKTKGGKEMTSLPFAGEQPYVNLFRVRGNIINIKGFTSSEYSQYLEELKKVWQETDYIDKLEQQSEKASRSKSIGGRFWYITWELSNHIGNQKKKSPSITWNWLFRSIGIDGVVDTGAGIIHTAEPTQAVFFSPQVIYDQERILNKYSPQRITKRQEMGQGMKLLKSRLQNMSLDQIEQFLLTHGPENIVSISDPNIRLELLKRKIGWIRYLDNTTDQEQQAVLTANLTILYNKKYIKDFRENNLVAVVAKNPTVEPASYYAIMNIFPTLSKPTQNELIKIIPKLKNNV